MKRLLIIFLLLKVLDAYGQKPNSIWAFGDSAGIDFNTPLNPLLIETAVDSRGSCVSIADTSGQLLFYAFTRMGQGDHSTRVYSSNNQIMMNGDSIIGEGNFKELVIVPKPGSASQFYLFSTGMVFSTIPGFYYSIIDMSLNNGNGIVIQKNIQLNNFRNADAVQAVRHGNGRDWWVISKYSSNPPSTFNRFYLYLITPGGISAPIIQDLFNAQDGDLQKLSFNPTGQKLMHVNILGLMCEYDFDRCTGIIFNQRVIFNEQSSNYNRLFFDGAYSSSSKEYFVNTIQYSAPADTAFLIQYHLNDSNPALTSDTIDYWLAPIGSGTLRLAPDNKIYFSRAYEWGFPGYPYPDSVYNIYNTHLSVINSPDSIGMACDYQPFSFSLGAKRTYYGLPNNPNYELKADSGSFCDTLTSSISSTESQGILLQVFYEPTMKTLFVNGSFLGEGNCAVQIFSLAGKLLYQISGGIYSGYYTSSINLSHFNSGVYILRISSNTQSLTRKFIKHN